MHNIDPEKLKQALRLAGDHVLILVATADREATPHIAAAGRLEVDGERLALTEWFCPATLENLSHGPSLSIVIWDAEADTGFQFVGKLLRVDDTAVLDGYAPGLESQPPIPQVRRRLVIEVEKMLEFKRGPHTDEPIEAERR